MLEHFAHEVRGDAERRAEHSRHESRCLDYGLVATGDIGNDGVGTLEIGVGGMCEGMVTDEVPTSQDFAHDIGVGFCLGPYDEENGFGLVLVEHIEQRERMARIGSVVES